MADFKGKSLRVAALAFFFVLLHVMAEGAEVLVVFSSDIAPYRQASEGFRKAFQEKRVPLAAVECNLEREGAETVIRHIASKKPDLVLTLGPEAARFAREKVRTIPVVFSMVLHPESFAGQNMTGVSLDVPFRVKLEKIARILPDVHKIGMVYSQASFAEYREVAQACRDLGYELVARRVESGRDFPQAFKDVSWRVEAFVMVPDPAIYFTKSIEYLLSEAVRSKLPVIGLSSSYTRAGALLSFDVDYMDAGRHAGYMAVKIIRGEKPSDIAPLRPSRITYSINGVVAERLGVKIPLPAVKEASEVFGGR